MKAPKIFLILMLTFPTLSFAETSESETIAKVSEDYAKCLNVALGNFDSDELSQVAMAKFFKTIVSNAEKLLKLELKAGSENTKVFLDMLGDEKIFVGYMVAKLSEPSKDFLVQKNDMNVQNDFDWRKTNKELWASNGCNALYSSLK